MPQEAARHRVGSAADDKRPECENSGLKCSSALAKLFARLPLLLRHGPAQHDYPKKQSTAPTRPIWNVANAPRASASSSAERQPHGRRTFSRLLHGMHCAERTPPNAERCQHSGRSRNSEPQFAWICLDWGRFPHAPTLALSRQKYCEWLD